MARVRKPADAPFRMSLTVYSADHPALAEALRAVPTGRRRVSRLLTLATVGALLEQRPATMRNCAAPMADEPTPRVRGRGGEGTLPLGLTVGELEDLGSWRE